MIAFLFKADSIVSEDDLAMEFECRRIRHIDSPIIAYLFDDGSVLVAEPCHDHGMDFPGLTSSMDVAFLMWFIFKRPEPPLKVIATFASMAQALLEYPRLTEIEEYGEYDYSIADLPYEDFDEDVPEGESI